jgi:hypothetical protein
MLVDIRQQQQQQQQQQQTLYMSISVHGSDLAGNPCTRNSKSATQPGGGILHDDIITQPMHMSEN